MSQESSSLFWMRKLQSILGIIPVGIFLIVHYSINSFAEKGAEAYTNSIAFMRSLPYLDLLEIGGIFIPITLHAIFGFIIFLSGKMNVISYFNFGNISYTFQRVSGIFLFFFLIYHVWHLRFFHPETGSLTAQLVQQRITSTQPIAIFYLLGVIMAGYHLVNGLYNFTIKWGITSGPIFRGYWAWICFLLGIILSGWGIHIWWVVTRLG